MNVKSFAFDTRVPSGSLGDSAGSFYVLYWMLIQACMYYAFDTMVHACAAVKWCQSVIQQVLFVYSLYCTLLTLLSWDIDHSYKSVALCHDIRYLCVTLSYLYIAVTIHKKIQHVLRSAQMCVRLNLCSLLYLQDIIIVYTYIFCIGD